MEPVRRFAAIVLLLLICGIGVGSEPIKVRGIKGLWWQGIDNYRLALPWLKEHNLNFLMLCYSSFRASGMDWRSDYSAEEKAQIKKLTADGKKMGVDICLSYNPGIWSNPPLVYSSDRDCELALNKVKSVHALGVRWFALCLDDINRGLQPADQERFGNLQAAQSYFVNRLWEGMKKLEPRPKLIFCPSAYTTGDAKAHMEYTLHIGKVISPEVMMFWTGPEVCSRSITAQDARLFGSWIHRKPFVWDNYPVNDMYSWRPLMGPLKNRSADLGSEISGYLANPMKQWHLSTIPLSTTAAYLNNPGGYNPDAVMSQLLRSYPEDQQRAVQLLVAIYGSSFWGEKNFPPMPYFNSRDDARKLLPKYRILARELSRNPDLKELWDGARDTLQADIAVIERACIDRRKESPLKANGLDFTGGAASVYGWARGDKIVNYVYAKPTGRNEMQTEFYLENIPVNGAALNILGLNDDLGVNGRIQIQLNDYIVQDGPANYRKDTFELKTYQIPESALKMGTNILTIRCTEEKGTQGWPPWFTVAEAELVPKY